MFSNLRNIHEPVAPVRFMKMIFLGVEIDFSEVELWCVPATNPIVCSKVPLVFSVIVCCGPIPFGIYKHVITALNGNHVIVYEGL